MDFTIKTYKKLLSCLKEHDYKFLTFSDYLSSNENNLPEKYIILRHDVDEQAANALKMSETEFNLGIKATYYFRIVRQSNKPEIINKIVGMGHEMGYHYEDLSTMNGDIGKAILSFENNLAYFRTFYDIKTVCMHGSSSSKWDNRLLWEKFNLKNYNLIGEPYLSLDFSKIFYLTDTGYAWDGGKYAVRDVVENPFGLSFHNTDQIIQCIKDNQFPNQAMILAHTLWTDNYIKWSALHIREFFRNNIKLIAKNNKIVSYLYKRLVKLYWKL